MIALVACMDAHRLIGLDGRLPWHLPADMAHFRALTMGHVVVMGRKTYESIGRPLEGRENYVVSSSEAHYGSDVWLASDLTLVIKEHRKDRVDLYVIGGASVYEQALPMADRIYITRIDHVFLTEGRVATYFPEWPGFRQTDAVPRFADEKNPYNLSFQIWERT